jgi:tetratricopeptide (TPR) repeat protein
VAAEAYFELGDTLSLQEAEPGRPLEKFREARDAFSRIPQLYTNSPLVPAAWGRIGDCYLQLATQDAKLYDSAAEAYQRVLAWPTADVGARSQAELGLALVRERQAQLGDAPDSAALSRLARDHYLNILFGSNLRDGEQPVPYWLKEAGLAAARLAEDGNDWERALKIYQRLLSLLPPMRPMLEKRMDRARERLRTAGQ